MSDFYVRSLKRLNDEYGTVDASLRYVQEQWRKQNLSLAIQSATPESLSQAISNLQSAYFIRLFSTFEGMLREHIAQHHPHSSVDEDTPAVRLIDRVSQLQGPHLSSQLREKIHEVRRHRNFLVHPGGASSLSVDFLVALARLSKFVDRLPEPRR